MESGALTSLLATWQSIWHREPRFAADVQLGKEQEKNYGGSAASTGGTARFSRGPSFRMSPRLCFALEMRDRDIAILDESLREGDVRRWPR